MAAQSLGRRPDHDGFATEIACELCVSVNTIRTHTRHMYAKLGVHPRSKAVDRAREPGPLAPSARSR